MMKPANRAALITVAALMTLALAAGAAVAMFPDGEAVTPTDLQELAKYRFVIDDGGSWELTLDEDEFALLEITPQYSGTWTFVSSGETAGGGDPWVQIYDAEGEPVDFADIARLPGSMAFSAGTLRYAVISVNWSMTDLEPADGQTFTVSVSHVDTGGVCGEHAVWNLDGDTLTLSGTGPMENFTYYGAPWHDHASLIRHVTVSEGITSVGDFAFQDCGITDAEIAGSVTSVGNYAFYVCTALTSLNLPEGLTSVGSNAFFASGLTSLDIPDGVTVIPEGAFASCPNLETVILRSGVTSINIRAFQNSGSLTVGCEPGSYALRFCQEKNIPWKLAPYRDTLTLPEDLTELGDEALAGITGPVNVVIPAGVNSLPDHAFSGSNVLLILPEGSPLFSWAEAHGIPAVAAE